MSQTTSAPRPALASDPARPRQMRPSPSIMRCQTSNASPNLRPWKAECRMRARSALTVGPRPPSSPSAISCIGARVIPGGVSLSLTVSSSPARLWSMSSAVARLFDAMADRYDELEPWYEHLYDVLHAIVREVIGRPPVAGARALDAGCGTGFQSTLLAELGWPQYGIDVPPPLP